MDKAEEPTLDVVVVGGGLAGLTAARDLAELNHSVVLLEARDRLGGRAWTGPFADTEYQVEIGGAWVAPSAQPAVSQAADRYGLEFVRDPDHKTYANLIGGQRTTGPIPVPTDELLDLERVWFHVFRAAARIEPSLPLDRQIGLEDLDVSWHDFLEPLALPTATRDYVDAWQREFGGRHPDEWSALHFLQWFAMFGASPLATLTSCDTKMAGGISRLVDALAAEGSVDIRLNSPVLRIDQIDRSVHVETADDTIIARCAVVAVPANLWGEIAFTPALCPAKTSMSAAGVGGRSVKIWALVADAPPMFFGVGTPEAGQGVIYLTADRQTPEGQLLVGFGIDSEDYDLTDSAQIGKAVQAYMPGCRLLRSDTYDWIGDPFSRGTWAAYPPGTATSYLADARRSEGRLAFATSDIARFFPGWLEGALESGAYAAGQAARLLEAATRETVGTVSEGRTDAGHHPLATNQRSTLTRG